MSSDAVPSQVFADCLLALDRLEAEQMLHQAKVAHSPLQLIESLVVPALEDIGRRWERGEAALAQVYMSSRICEELVVRLLPLSQPDQIKQPKLGIALLDDYHALGKIIVCVALRSRGWDFHDYGRMTASELAERVVQDKINILLISTLMLRSALQIKELKAALNAAQVSVKIIVGGAPFRFDPKLWQEVGADATGNNATEAVQAVACCMEELEK